MTLLCFAQIGVSSVPPMFWPLPASFLTGASAAAGIAAINSLGNLSGFAGQFAMGYLKDLTGNFTVGLLLLPGCAVLGAAVVLTLRIDAKREQSSGKSPWRINTVGEHCRSPNRRDQDNHVSPGSMPRAIRTSSGSRRVCCAMRARPSAHSARTLRTGCRRF
jgi:hypothetical protein